MNRTRNDCATSGRYKAKYRYGRIDKKIKDGIRAERARLNELACGGWLRRRYDDTKAMTARQL